MNASESGVINTVSMQAMTYVNTSPGVGCSVRLEVHQLQNGPHSAVEVRAPERTDVEATFAVFDRHPAIGSDTAPSGSAGSHDRLQLDVEAFVSLWHRLSPEVSLVPDDRRIGDALAIAATELVKTEDPPRGVLRAMFGWFQQRVTTGPDPV